MSFIQEQFIKTMSRTGLDFYESYPILEELKVLYESPDRAYHNWAHIKHFFKKYKFFVPNNIKCFSFEFAIFLHDAVYIPGRKDNEEKSAEYAEELLTRMDRKTKTGPVTDLILSTKTHKPCERLGEMGQYFLDCDMAILGTRPERYKIYLEKINKEYSGIDHKIYLQGRAKFLKMCLDKPIYHTKPFKCMYEGQAKDNLKEELKQIVEEIKVNEQR